MQKLYLEDETRRIPLPLGGGNAPLDFTAAVAEVKKLYAGTLKKLTLKHQWHLTDGHGRRISLQEVYPAARR